MPAARLSMGKIREILRLKHERGLSHRAIAQACAIGVGTVSLYLQRTAQQGLGWPLPAELDDAALEARLYPRATALRNRVRPDCAHIHRELKHNGVTLQLLWEEYAEVHPNGYGRTRFFALYRQWAQRLRPSMRQVHRAGEKTFVDFSGKRPALVDRCTGERRRVELFVAVLGASSFTRDPGGQIVHAAASIGDPCCRIAAKWVGNGVLGSVDGGGAATASVSGQSTPLGSGASGSVGSACSRGDG